MIEVRNVSKAFGAGESAVRALDDVDVTIAQNEFFTLLGPSGCGKTTLLRLIAGFEHPSSGTIRLAGDDITLLPPNKRPVNTVFQNYALFPHMTVAGNISFGLEMLDRPANEIAETVDRMLKLVKMEDLRNRKTTEISGGQQQRVALARALAPQPKVLLLDEPLSALDLKLRKEMQRELKRLQSETGITFVFVTHDQEEALTMSDRIAVMQDGKILQVGTPREIYNHPVNRFVADFIGETNFLTGKVESGKVRLSSGEVLAADGAQGLAEDRDVTVTVRPEQVRIADLKAANGLAATVSDIVYFGTDSHFHLRLSDGSEVVARLQSQAAGDDALSPGAEVRIQFADGAAQVLER